MADVADPNPSRNLDLFADVRPHEFLPSPVLPKFAPNATRPSSQVHHRRSPQSVTHLSTHHPEPPVTVQAEEEPEDLVGKMLYIAMAKAKMACRKEDQGYAEACMQRFLTTCDYDADTKTLNSAEAVGFVCAELDKAELGEGETYFRACLVTEVLALVPQAKHQVTDTPISRLVAWKASDSLKYIVSSQRSLARFNKALLSKKNQLVAEAEERHQQRERGLIQEPSVDWSSQSMVVASANERYNEPSEDTERNFPGLLTAFRDAVTSACKQYEQNHNRRIGSFSGLFSAHGKQGLVHAQGFKRRFMQQSNIAGAVAMLKREFTAAQVRNNGKNRLCDQSFATLLMDHIMNEVPELEVQSTCVTRRVSRLNTMLERMDDVSLMNEIDQDMADKSYLPDFSFSG